MVASTTSIPMLLVCSQVALADAAAAGVKAMPLSEWRDAQRATSDGIAPDGVPTEEAALDAAAEASSAMPLEAAAGEATAKPARTTRGGKQAASEGTRGASKEAEAKPPARKAAASGHGHKRTTPAAEGAEEVPQRRTRSRVTAPSH
jgi:hypothetical protein